MQIKKSGNYICKIVYNPTDEKYNDSLDILISNQPFTKCKVHIRRKNRIWFHDVEECNNNFLEKYNLFQPVYSEGDDVYDDYYDPLAGFIYEYDETKDMYICKNQILKHTGGFKWNLYIKLYQKL